MFQHQLRSFRLSTTCQKMTVILNLCGVIHDVISITAVDCKLVFNVIT